MWLDPKQDGPSTMSAFPARQLVPPAFAFVPVTVQHSQPVEVGQTLVSIR